MIAVMQVTLGVCFYGVRPLIQIYVVDADVYQTI